MPQKIAQPPTPQNNDGPSLRRDQEWIEKEKSKGGGGGAGGRNHWRIIIIVIEMTFAFH